MSDFTWNFRASSTSARRSAQDIHDLHQNVRQLDDVTRRTQKSSDSFFKSWTRGASVFNVWNRAVRYAIDDLKILGRVFVNFLKNVQDIGGRFQLAASTLTGFLGDATKTIEVVKNLGRTTRWTAAQVADAAVQLAKAGYRETIVNMLEPVLQAAEATGISTAKAARIASTGVKQFAKTGEDATKVLQLYTSAGNASLASIESIAAAMKNVAPIASQLGLNVQKTATMVALLADRGIHASRAGTALKMALLRLQDTTPAADRALMRLGINLKNINFKEPAQFLEVFRQALQRIPEGDRLQVLSDIFGKRAVVAILPLIEQGSAGFQKMFDIIGDGQSQMQTFQSLMQQTIPGAMKVFESASEGVFVELARILDLPIQTFWRTLADILNTITDRINQVGQAFGENTNTLEGWIDIIRGGGLEGIFEGIFQDIQPQIEQLKTLFGAAWTTIVELGREAFKTLFTKEIVQGMEDAFVDIGFFIGKGIIKGVSAVVGELKNRMGLEEIWEHPWGVVKELAGMGGLTTIQGLRLGYNQKQPPKTRGGASGTWGEPERRMPITHFRGGPLEFGGVPATPAVSAKTTTQLKTEEDARIRGIRLTVEAAKKYRQEIEAAGTAHQELNLALAESEKNFRVALLEPVNKFRQMILSVKRTFDELVSGLRTKMVDIGERFGLLTGEEASGQRVRLGRGDLATLRNRLDLAQTPAERQAIFQAMAGKAEGLAGMTEGRFQTRYAKEAQNYLRQAISQAKEQEAIELQKIKLEQQFAQESVKQLSAMRGNAGSIDKELEIAKQLQDSLLTLGRTLEATSLQQDIRNLQRETAGKTNEYLENLVGYAAVAEDLMKEGVELAKQQLQATQEIDITPLDPAMATP